MNFTEATPYNFDVVILNVYDLHDANSYLSNVGLGLFHTGVQIRGYEYSFSQVGISKTAPKSPIFGNFRESIEIGQCQGNLEQILNDFRSADFAPGMYDLTKRNCNHFSDSFCRALAKRGIPDSINRVADVGTALRNANETVQEIVNPYVNYVQRASSSTAQSVTRTVYDSELNCPICKLEYTSGGRRDPCLFSGCGNNTVLAIPTQYTIN